MKLQSKVLNTYPSFRNDTVKSINSWLAGRQLEDNAEGLWRIHDKLYDFSDFITTHPGGQEWLKITKGTDITEAFETHHIRNVAEKLLPTFYVRDAALPRNYNFTFHPDGFFKTLQRRVASKLPIENQKEIINKSKLYCDFMLVMTILSFILASREFNAYIALLAASCLAMLIVISHNFLHQRDNWRMYVMNLSTQSFRDWRVFHALSHHMYPNTMQDLEAAGYEPFFNFFPTKKNFIQKYVAWLYLPFFQPLVFLFNLLRIIDICSHGLKKLHWDDFLPLALPCLMYLFGSAGFLETIVKWLSLIALSGLMYSIIVIATGSGGHHNDKIYHDGDALKSLDYGVYTLAATFDKIELHKNQFGVMTTFGQHVAHHLFPTLDHGLLLQLNDLIFDTCKEFEVELITFPWYTHMIGQYFQLAREKPHEMQYSQK